MKELFSFHRAAHNWQESGRKINQPPKNPCFIGVLIEKPFRIARNGVYLV
jgi:hypothetical protein